MGALPSAEAQKQGAEGHTTLCVPSWWCPVTIPPFNRPPTRPQSPQRVPERRQKRLQAQHQHRSTAAITDRGALKWRLLMSLHHVQHMPHIPSARIQCTAPMQSGRKRATFEVAHPCRARACNQHRVAQSICLHPKATLQRPQHCFRALPPTSTPALACSGKRAQQAAGALQGRRAAGSELPAAPQTTSHELAV